MWYFVYGSRQSAPRDVVLCVVRPRTLSCGVHDAAVRASGYLLYSVCTVAGSPRLGMFLSGVLCCVQSAPRDVF